MKTKRPKPVPRIRIALADDSSPIASVLYDSFLEYETLYTPEAFAATTPTSDQVRHRLTEGPVWVVLFEDAIVGTVAVVDRDDELYIRGMAVLPSARGLRIGELLLKQIETFASERGNSRLVLSTTPFLARAIRLYQQAGFIRSNEGTDNLLGTQLFTMVKLLKVPEVR